MMKTSPTHRTRRSNRDPGLQLLRRIARAADAIARNVRREPPTPESDQRIWDQAERKILGPSDSIASVPP